MASVLELGALREKKRRERERAGPRERGRPKISDREIWTKDYASLDGVVFGASLIREILDYHCPYDLDWPYLVLALVDAVYKLELWGVREVEAAANAVKSFTLSKMTAANKRDLTAVLLLADLIEKTPHYRRSEGR